MERDHKTGRRENQVDREDREDSKRRTKYKEVPSGQTTMVLCV